MTTISRLLAAIALTLLLGLSAACGNAPDDDGSALPDAAGASSDAADGDEADLDPEDAMLEFAQCMREHGVDMADPEPGGGGVRINGEGHPQEQMKAAETACQKWMDMARPEDGGVTSSPRRRSSRSSTWRPACASAATTSQIPTFEGGRVTQRMEQGDGDVPGPEDPAFEQDRKECEAEAGLEPPTADDGGSIDEQEA